MVEYLSLKNITAMHSDELQQAVSTVVDSGWYLQGNAISAFESQYASYIGTEHCISCGNGLDALSLILRAYIEMGVMKEGDEVIVPANTYIATILAITDNRLTPVLIEPDADTLEIDDSLISQAITHRTRAIMIVHLYGRCAYTERIGEICRQRNLKLIEDNAQAHGCMYLPAKRRTGSLGDAAAHSFYPGKNLGAFGDAGAVTTSDTELANTVRTLANYGSSRKYVFPYRGRNSRMDELQAAVLSVKLQYLDADNDRRRDIARRLISGIDNGDIRIPDTPETDNVWHIFPVFCSRRDRLQQHLSDRGIKTMIHYPIPPHRQECYREWNHLSFPITEAIHATELSLPCNQAMTSDDVEEVIEAVNSFKME